MVKYTKCPECGKKGVYTKLAKNPSDSISLGHRGFREICKYCDWMGK